MTSQFDAARAKTQERITALVASGRDVRAQVAAVVSEVAGQFPLEVEGFVGLCRSVVEGATAAVSQSLPDEPDSLLRQVVEGLGDGLAAAAHATELAVREAASHGRRFADEDVVKVSDELSTLGEMFVELVSRGAKTLTTQAGARVAELSNHARNTARRIQPAIEVAVRAVRQEPKKLTKEAASTGLRASRLAAGALFSAIGGLMSRAGGKLRGTD